MTVVQPSGKYLAGFFPVAESLTQRRTAVRQAIGNWPTLGGGRADFDHALENVQWIGRAMANLHRQEVAGMNLFQHRTGFRRRMIHNRIAI
ncbi:hypothetical protein D3C71_1389430 [compost metagenome]